MRLLITGVPRAGKTTLAKALIDLSNLPWTVIHWDSYKHLPWDAQPFAVLGDLKNVTTPHVCVEGVGASRLLHRGTAGDRETWIPDRILECMRAELADPKHKGHATRIAKELAAWRGTERYVAIPDARKVALLMDLALGV